MQTFLPYPNFTVSAMHLDRARLGKQRVEALQISRSLHGITNGWSNHPAVRMWRGFERALDLYRDVMIREWIRRGYQNNMVIVFEDLSDLSSVTMPTWLGDERLHSSHRSRLLLKDPDWYNQWGWTEEPGAEYHWPEEVVHETPGTTVLSTD